MRYPTGAPEGNDWLKITELPERELPESASPANNPALNRSAEAVGRGVGTAVAGVRRLPAQFERLRSRIHLIGGREGGTPMTEKASETATEWRDEVEERLAEFKQQAESYTYDFADRSNRRLDEFRRSTAQRLDRLRQSARQWVGNARHWSAERPLQTIAGCTAAGFCLGVALRIWRSNSE